MTTAETNMTTAEFIKSLEARLQSDDYYALLRRAREAFGHIITGTGWMTFQDVTEKFADESPDFIRLVLFHLRDVECLFDNDLLDDEDWELSGEPDSSKFWSGAIAEFNFNDIQI